MDLLPGPVVTKQNLCKLISYPPGCSPWGVLNPEKPFRHMWAQDIFEERSACPTWNKFCHQVIAFAFKKTSGDLKCYSECGRYLKWSVILIFQNQEYMNSKREIRGFQEAFDWVAQKLPGYACDQDYHCSFPTKGKQGRACLGNCYMPERSLNALCIRVILTNSIDICWLFKKDNWTIKYGEILDINKVSLFYLRNQIKKRIWH